MEPTADVLLPVVTDIQDIAAAGDVRPSADPGIMLVHLSLAATAVVDAGPF